MQVADDAKILSFVLLRIALNDPLNPDQAQKLAPACLSRGATSLPCSNLINLCAYVSWYEEALRMCESKSQPTSSKLSLQACRLSLVGSATSKNEGLVMRPNMGQQKAGRARPCGQDAGGDEKHKC